MTNAQTEELIATQGVTLNLALKFHLMSRIFPPVDDSFVPAIKQAIDNCALTGAGEDVELPNGKTVSDYEIVEQLNLRPFVDARAFGYDWTEDEA